MAEKWPFFSLISLFYELFPENEIALQVAAQIYQVPWGHIIYLLNIVRGNRDTIEEIEAELKTK